MDFQPFPPTTQRTQPEKECRPERPKEKEVQTIGHFQEHSDRTGRCTSTEYRVRHSLARKGGARSRIRIGCPTYQYSQGRVFRETNDGPHRRKGTTAIPKLPFPFPANE